MYPRHDNGIDEYDQIDGDEGIYLTARAPLLFGETASSGGLKLIRTSDHLPSHPYHTSISPPWGAELQARFTCECD